MKSFVLPVIFSILAGILVSSCQQMQSKNTEPAGIKILVITGGHDFEDGFFDLFKEMDGIQFDTISQPAANDVYGSAMAETYDAFVFYDMVQAISDRQKKDFINLLKKGKGIVFLHHSLVSYQDWDLFHDILGGKYFEKGYLDDTLRSTYRHDLELDVHIADTTHPVTRGINDFIIHDEGYGNIRVNDYVHTLLTTDHADCATQIGWTNAFGNSKIVYLMLGHDQNAWRNISYRKLLHNALFWVSNRSL